MKLLISTVLVALYVCLAGIDFENRTAVYCNDEKLNLAFPKFEEINKPDVLINWRKDERNCTDTCVYWRAIRTFDGAICIELKVNGGREL